MVTFNKEWVEMTVYCHACKNFFPVNFPIEYTQVIKKYEVDVCPLCNRKLKLLSVCPDCGALKFSES
jgi:hypothetical protein